MNTRRQQVVSAFHLDGVEYEFASFAALQKSFTL